MGTAILRIGLVNSPGDAAVILAIAAGLLIAGSMYLLASAVPPPVELGPDEPRQGERIPSYRGGQ